MARSSFVSWRTVREAPRFGGNGVFAEPSVGNTATFALSAVEDIAIPDRRTVLLDSSIGLVENSSVSAARPPSGYSSDFQVVLPYRGLFEYQVGRARHLIDVNRILFVVGGQEFIDRHPVLELGHASVIITPMADTLDELFWSRAGKMMVDVTSRPSDPHSQVLTHRLLHAPGDNPLVREELMLEVLDAALGTRKPHAPPSALVNRAKEFLHACGLEPMTLATIAKAVGASPVYLTQEFTRSEGIPLYRYQMRIRLARALSDLPTIDNITRLAFDLGFSSHSHFTSAFRALYDLTPSQYRQMAA